MKNIYKSLSITFLLSIALAILLYFFKEHKNTLLLGSALYMWIPGIVALCFAKKEKFKLPLASRRAKSFFATLLISFLAVALIFLFSLPFESSSFRPLLKVAPSIATSATRFLIFFGAGFIGIIIAGCTVNLLAALGEELMWRGFLWEKTKHLGFTKASLLIGAMWGIWHSPMIILLGHNYPKYSAFGAILFIVLCIAMSPVFLYIRLKYQSVIFPALFHGMLNAGAGVTFLFFEQHNHFLVGMTGLAGLFAFIVMNLLVCRKYFKSKSADELCQTTLSMH